MNIAHWFLFISVLGDGAGCPMGMFRCLDGKCIPSLWVCNYQKDCENAEDEFQSCRKCPLDLPHFKGIGLIDFQLCTEKELALNHENIGLNTDNPIFS